MVWRAGIGAVTWGVSSCLLKSIKSLADLQGLIVALGTVFAGLGGWGGVV
jgi:hypothetical protein